MFHLSRPCNYFLSYGSRVLMLCVSQIFNADLSTFHMANLSDFRTTSFN
uniref:Uncharacterized protein n=1 Tax=Arundo donax TaxID=35708 RepID=A0A0A9F892_ARUDO